MSLKKIVTVFILLNFALIAFAETNYSLGDLTWNGSLLINLDKTSFDADEEITGNLLFENSEHFPLIGQRIILQVASGEYSYPSQFSNDNIIIEKVFEDEWILQRRLKKIDFSLGTLKPGNYRLDVYSWALKSMFIGSDAILYNPIRTNFVVEGSKVEGEVFIERRTTNFGEDKVVGPVGFPVKPGEEFPGEIFITNNTSEQKNNLTLTIEICDWSNAFCTGELFDSGQQKITKEINVPPIPPNQTIQIDTTLTAPQIPSAYEINMKLKENNEILSIYKNRVIVEGGTAKLRKILFDGLKYRDYSLKVLVAGSPDHFTFPDFDNFQMKMTVYYNEEVLEEQTQQFNKLRAGEVKSHTYKITQEIFDKICVETTKNNIVYDKECFTIDIGLLQLDYDKVYPEEMNVVYNYNSLSEELEISISKDISNKINGRIRLLENEERMIINERIESEGIFEKNYSIRKENYILIIDDLDARHQHTFFINLKDDEARAYDLEQLSSCGGIICSAGTVCSIQTYKSDEGDCCMGDCIPEIQREGQLFFSTLPFIFWIALILLIIAIIFLGNTILDRGEKR